MSSKPRAKGEKGLESHLLHWAKHIYSGATGKHTQGLCWMPPCWLDAFWLCEASCLLPPNIKLYNAGCYGFHGLTPCFSLPIFQAHLPKAQAWLSPNLQFCLGLAAEGRADSPPPKLAVILNRGEAPGLCLGLPRKQSARAKVTLLHSPRLCSYFVCFILQVLLCDSNKPTAPCQEFLSCAANTAHQIRLSVGSACPSQLSPVTSGLYLHHLYWALEGCLWSVWVGLWLMLLPQRAYHLKMGI